ncbi:hypothetical protein EXS70_02965 [Candidatus Peribacteria bacterium]|nr:hypothetical protein [Candidatus Peribacteria bacterium]
MAIKRPTGKKSVTLRDVVVHMQGMEQRLTKRIDGVDVRVSRVDIGLTKLDNRLTEVEERLTTRIDALDEDLTATIMDTVKIRKHVGMAVPVDE